MEGNNAFLQSALNVTIKINNIQMLHLQEKTIYFISYFYHINKHASVE